MVSATQLSSYLYCPRKLFITDVLMIKSPVKEELVKGKIWHETYEMINKNEQMIVSSITTKHYVEILGIYRREYSRFLRNSIIKNKAQLKEFNIPMIDLFKEYWENFEEEAKNRSLNISQFIERHEVFGALLWEKLTPKIISECYYKSEDLNLSGIIDIIEVHHIEDRKIHVPVELKTGKVPLRGMWDGHRIQLAAYMMLLKDCGFEVSEGVMQYKGADRRILQMNTMLNDEVSLLIKKVDFLLQSEKLPNFVDNRNKCASCPFKETCYNQDAMKTLLNEAKLRKNAKNLEKLA